MNTLKSIRKEHNLSQGELAKKSNVSIRSIQNYEQNHRNLNTADAIVVYQLAKALNTRMELLINQDLL